MKLLHLLRSDSFQKHYNKLKLLIKATACQITVLQAELTLIANNGVELKGHRVDLALL